MSEKDTPRGSTDGDAGVVPSPDFNDEDAAETHVWKGAAPGPVRSRPPPVPGRPPLNPGPPSSVFFVPDFEEELATLARGAEERARGSLPPPAPAAKPAPGALEARETATEAGPGAASSEPTETMALADIERAIGGGAEPLSSPPARFAKATAQTLGRSFAGFRIVRKIAEGGMASVFLGRKAGPRGFNQHAAVKVVHPHFADQRAFVEMFLDEARIAALVQHPNVCRVLDFGHANGTYFLAMEYVHGEPWAELAQALYGHPEGAAALPVIAAHVISLACEGLHAAHQAVDETGKPLHIVHRDVSPQNILVAFDGTVRVLDFGIASATDRLTTTRTGTVKGRLSYMAPEQMRGDSVDARADVWSLGVVLREALEGRRLFRRQAEAATMLAVCSDPLPEWSNHVPEALRAVVDRALTRERQHRYASARDLGVALAEFVHSQDTAISSADLSGWLERLFPDRIETKRAWLRQPVPEPSPDEPAVVSAEARMASGLPPAESVPAPGDVPELPAPAPSLPPVPTRAELVESGSAPGMPVPVARRRRRGGLWLTALLVLGGAVWLATDRYMAAREEAQARREEAARFLRETADGPAVRGASPAIEEAPSEANAPSEAPRPGAAAEAPPQGVAPAADENVVEVPSAASRRDEEAEPADGTSAERRRQRRARQHRSASSERPSERPEAPAQPPGEPGTLVVAFVGGWAEIYVGNEKLGTTPGRFELPSGPAKVVLKPFGAGPEIVRRVDVPAGGQRKLIVEP